MRVLAFGTYDAAVHPRVATLIEGLRDRGCDVDECNVPLGLSTADKVGVLTRPWRVPLLVARIARCWWRLARTARRLPDPDAVLVGYLGHFDVHLARRLFPRVPIVLDHLVGASDTAKDRRVDGGVRQRLLRMIDSGALRAADVVVVDTEEHLAALPDARRPQGLVVQVGAPHAWFDAARAPADTAPAGTAPAATALSGSTPAGTAPPGPTPAGTAPPGTAPPGATPAGADTTPGPLRVIFFGLFTPLQGTPVIGAALGSLGDAPIRFTMIGTGQDLAETRAAADRTPDGGAGCEVRWLDWVPSGDLPGVVAAHDVCLGIFGAGDKARRVVPNKVFQGMAAGCAVITSDTAPQRRVLGDAAVLVPPGDARAVADALRHLAADRAALVARRAAAGALARERFTASAVVAPLVGRLHELVEKVPQ